MNMKKPKEKTGHIGLIIGCTLFFIVVLFICFFIPENTFGEEYEEEIIISNEVSNESMDAGLTFEQQVAQFPASYQAKIRAIHAIYPNYTFQADYLSVSFDEAVYQESLDHRKLINFGYDGVSWRSLSPANYNPSTNTWNTYCGNWTDAAIDVIEYHMDPRNFLDTQNMFMFAQQTYTGKESRSGVENIAKNSFLAGTYKDSTGTHNYIDVIMQAAAESKVSPYVIAATIRSEQPTNGNSSLIDGSRGYYNFFNIGAYGSDVVGNGIAYAKGQGWNTVYKSIVGGAKFYYNGYLKYGQDTYYYKDFNVVIGNYDYQYAQGVYDPVSSAYFLRNAIGNDTSAALVLRIPVYQKMWADPPAYPPKTSSLNSRYLLGATKTGWVQQNETWYYIDWTLVKRRGWLKSGDFWYYLGANGAMQTGWTKVGGYWYYMYDFGGMKTGWLNDRGTWYYLTSSGAMKTGWLQWKNNWYYMDYSGAMRTGWTKINGQWFYFESTGEMKTGWFEDKYGRYYLTDYGNAKTGWLHLDNAWYYFNEKCYMQTGWVAVNNNKYFFEENGKMRTGWFEEDGKRFFIDESGAAHKGWLCDDGVWYFTDENGTPVTGWIKSGGYWFYLLPDGTMAHEEWFGGYWFNSYGAWVYTPIGSWHLNEKGWWFGDTSGWYAKNATYKINGAEYQFDEAGYWIEPEAEEK